MFDITKIQERMNLIRSELTEMYDNVKAEKRDSTDAEVEKAVKLNDEFDRLKANLAASQRSNENLDWLDDMGKPNKPETVGDGNVDADTRDETQSWTEFKPFKNFGEQMAAVYRASIPGHRGEETRKLMDYNQRAASGLGESVPSDGGFLIQQDFSNEMIKKVHETGILVPRCRKIPIGPGKNGIKINAIDESSRATGSRWGGIRGYWANEAELKTGSKPKFRQIELTLEKLIGLCYATDELLDDSTALGAILSEGFAEEFAFMLDDAIVEGDGAGKPIGFKSSGCIISAAKAQGQAAKTILYTNIVDMWARLYNQSRRNAVWLINQDCIPQMYTMNLAVGAGGVPVWMPAGGASASPYSSLFSRPVIEIEQCETLGTTGDIYLIDLSQYLLIEKGAMNSASSIHVRFIYDESTFRFVYRVDGQMSWNLALTPFKGTNTVSPAIKLDTRA